MNPAQHTLVVLSEYKAIGVPFSVAWASAMRTLPRGSNRNGSRDEYREWKRALNWARPAWEAAYTDQDFVVTRRGKTRSSLKLSEPERVAA